MNATVEKSLCLLEESPAQNDNASGAIADFIILRLGQLNHQLGNLGNKSEHFILSQEMVDISCSYLSIFSEFLCFNHLVLSVD
jgi:hypothetical protein